LISAISAAVGVRISYAQKRLGAVFAAAGKERDVFTAKREEREPFLVMPEERDVFTATGEERDAKPVFAVHPAVRQTANPHATLSIAAQTIRPVDRTPHHHLSCYRPAASVPQVPGRGMDLLTRLTRPASG
jgi:hypothetical protein